MLAWVCCARVWGMSWMVFWLVGLLIGSYMWLLGVLAGWIVGLLLGWLVAGSLGGDGVGSGLGLSLALAWFWREGGGRSVLGVCPGLVLGWWPPGVGGGVGELGSWLFSLLVGLFVWVLVVLDVLAGVGVLGGWFVWRFLATVSWVLGTPPILTIGPLVSKGSVPVWAWPRHLRGFTFCTAGAVGIGRRCLFGRPHFGCLRYERARLFHGARGAVPSPDVLSIDD